ncbi:hypothetical protein [Rhodobaculum claviforme]|uniref:Lipoprotein n=1 Tax=Rhodobaculum claviforme TaxID=1549854 RepID=A0A934TN87_9RHOB|nr:hypothetical protein [Rhodobaculum claviforme]MBK5928734.1 hypothetical protein [Rhodobaculum claviforme]
MKTPALAALTALVLLSACAGVRQSAVNPFNWFGGSTSRTVEATAIPEGGFAEVIDNRPAVAEVIDMAVEPAQGGAIVRATGLPPTQGWWDAELRPDGDLAPVDGELTLRFVLAPPRQETRQGPARSREVSAGLFVPASVLAQTRRVTVIGERNARTVTRR